MPHEVLDLLKKWNQEIDLIGEEFVCKASIGYAYVDFIYDSSVYKLQPIPIITGILIEMIFL